MIGLENIFILHFTGNHHKYGLLCPGTRRFITFVTKSIPKVQKIAEQRK